MREFPRIVHSHLRHIMQSKTVIIEAELIYRSDGSFIKVPAAAYSARVRALEAEGCDTSDAQGIADAEFLATISAPLCHDLGPSEPEDTEPAVFNPAEVQS
jgi:hypothetical protein